MRKYKKLDDKFDRYQKKISKKKLLKSYHFSLPLRFLILYNIIDIKKCGLKTI